jgi:hypothetical protein
MRRLVSLIFLAALLPVSRYIEAQAAQDSSPAIRQEAPYLLPQTIFVGDRGRLVVPLGQAFMGVEPFVVEAPEKLPRTPDLVIHRIELERRGGTPRLLLDFIPYAPGTLFFPSLAFPSLSAESLTLTGLSAEVASILDPSQAALSEPVPPLAVPGTSLLIYGTARAVLAFLFLVIGGSFWGRRHFREFWERFRRRHLLRVMARFLKRLGMEGTPEKNGKPGFLLTLLSGEFREFLSLFTGINCRSLTAGEFLELPLGRNDTGSPLLTPDFLCRLFRSWDTLRFSGRDIERPDLLSALAEVEKFIGALDRAEREHSWAQVEPRLQKEGL